MAMLYRRVDWLRVIWVLILNTAWLSSIGVGVVVVGPVAAAAARASREERLQSVQRLLSEVPLIDG